MEYPGRKIQGKGGSPEKRMRLACRSEGVPKSHQVSLHWSVKNGGVNF